MGKLWKMMPITHSDANPLICGSRELGYLYTETWWSLVKYYSQGLLFPWIFWSSVLGEHGLLWFLEKDPPGTETCTLAVWSFCGIWKLWWTRAPTLCSIPQSSLWPYLLPLVSHEGVSAFIHSTNTYLLMLEIWQVCQINKCMTNK